MVSLVGPNFEPQTPACELLCLSTLSPLIKPRVAVLSNEFQGTDWGHPTYAVHLLKEPTREELITPGGRGDSGQLPRTRG